ncbi:MAG: hypothetical protein RR565_04095 [Erysipelothrix sp.]
MFTSEMDERMLAIRGKGVLYGFLLLIVMIVVKDFCVDIFEMTIESTTRFDFAMIYVCLFFVVSYMMTRNGLDDQVVHKSKIIMTIIALFFVASSVISLILPDEGRGLYTITNTHTIFVQAITTSGYAILAWRKSKEIHNQF